MCNCPGVEASGCIAEYVCPACYSRWRRDSRGNWVKGQNPHTTAPEPSKLPTSSQDELADREALRYEDDMVKSWNLF